MSASRWLGPRAARLTRRGAVLGEVVALVGVAVLLISHGVRDLSRSGGEVLLAWLGLCAVPVLALVACRLTVQVRQAKAEASDNARRLAGAARTSRELVWEITLDGTITYMSAVATDMFGVGPAELTGRSVFMLLPPHEQPVAQATLARCVQERRGWTGLIFEAIHADGLPHWVETSGIAHLDHTGRVRGFTATTRRLDAETRQRIAQERLRSRILDVLGQDRVRTVFQPIVDIGSGRTVGYEALSRFDSDPSQTPDRWFADADAVGLGVELDCLTVRAALAAAPRLPADCYVSINATPATLAAGRLAALIAAAPVPAEMVVIEITEHVSVEDYQALRDPLDQLRSQGVRIAVDDTGSGYASLRHILRLRPELIKIDQEIIRGIHLDPTRRALATALVMFARDLGATVIAEGIDNVGDLATVSTLGIDAAQGFLLGRPDEQPQPASEVPLRQPDNVSILPVTRHRELDVLTAVIDQ